MTTNKKQAITLTPSRQLLRFPPGVETKVKLTQVAKTLHEMKTVTVVIRDSDEASALRARVQELEAQAKTHADNAWLEAAVTRKQIADAQRKAAAAELLLQAHANEARLAEEVRLQELREPAHVTDNTKAAPPLQAFVCTDAVILSRKLDPRKAVPMKLPFLSWLKLWLRSAE
jgi:hypothetical protein